MNLRDYLWNTDGTPRQGATVRYRLASDVYPNPNPVLASVGTDANGMWAFVAADGQVYDVEVQDGTEIIRYKGNAAIPHSFANGHIAAAADIELTKLDQGSGSDAQPIATAITNLDLRLNQIISVINLLRGSPGWVTSLPTFFAPTILGFNNALHTHANAVGGGPVVTPNRDQFCRVYRTSNVTIPGSGAQTGLTWNQDRYDPGDWHAVDQGRITVPRTGTYAIGTGFAWSGGSAVGVRRCWITLNGGAYLAESTVAAAPNSASVTTNLNTVRRLTAGDYVAVLVAQDSGINLDVQWGGSNENTAEFWAAALD